MNEVEQKLLARRAALLGDIAERDQEIAVVQIDEEEGKNVERLEEEVLSAVNEGDQHELARIDAALARLADGSYGICAECGEKIAPARLEAQPDAVLCINCASAA